MFQSQKDEVGSELFKSDIVTKGKKDCGNVSDYRRLRNHDSHQMQTGSCIGGSGEQQTGSCIGGELCYNRLYWVNWQNWNLDRRLDQNITSVQVYEVENLGKGYMGILCIFLFFQSFQVWNYSPPHTKKINLKI